jgi:hypothetical protein
MKLIKDGKFNQLITITIALYASDLIKKVKGLKIQRSKNELTR